MTLRHGTPNDRVFCITESCRGSRRDEGRAPVDAIEGIGIDSDEGGFLLMLDGDFVDTFEDYLNRDGTMLYLRLPQDMALKLLASVREQIEPWAAEGEQVRAERAAHVARGLCGYWVPGAGPCRLLEGHTNGCEAA